MSLPAHIASAILEMVIGRLAILFRASAGGEIAAARHAVTQMLAGFRPETPDQLTLAAEIIAFHLQTLEALSDAAKPEMTLNQIIRLRGAAVALSREAHKARRKLDQLQRPRREKAKAAPVQAPVEAPVQTPVAATVEPTNPAPANPNTTAPAAPKPAAVATAQTWSQSLQQRMKAQRKAEKLKKQQARQAHLASHRPSNLPAEAAARPA